MIQIMKGKSQPRAHSKPGEMPLRSAARNTEFAKTDTKNTWERALPALLDSDAPPGKNRPE
jgi:hypothetical protein